MQRLLRVRTRGDDTAGAQIAVSTIEPDFSVISLPTSLVLPHEKFAFRLVHRFSRPLDGGRGYGNLLEDLFGFGVGSVSRRFWAATCCTDRAKRRPAPTRRRREQARVSDGEADG